MKHQPRHWILLPLLITIGLVMPAGGQAQPLDLADDRLERSVLWSTKLEPTVDSELVLEHVQVDHLPDDSQVIYGTLTLSDSESQAFTVEIDADPDAGTYTARRQPAGAVRFEEDYSAWDAYPRWEEGNNAIPNPQEGCPVRICHRTAWVGGREECNSAGGIKNTTRTRLTYTYYADTADLFLISYEQVCTAGVYWTLNGCGKPAPITGHRIEVATEGGYVGYAFPNDSNTTWMEKGVAIAVLNGVQQLSWYYSDGGRHPGCFTPVLTVSAYSCQTYLMPHPHPPEGPGGPNLPGPGQ